MFNKIQTMCFSAAASLAAFMWVIIASIFIIGTVENIFIVRLAYFAMYVGLVQLIELMIWTMQEDDESLNHRYAMVNMFLQMTQPVVLFLLLVDLYPENDLGLVVAKIVVIVYVAYLLWRLANVDLSGVIVTPNCDTQRLQNPWWSDSETQYLSGIPYIFTFLIVILIMVKPRALAVALIIFGLLTIGLAWILTRVKSDQTFPSVWCFTAVLLPAFLLGYDYLT